MSEKKLYIITGKGGVGKTMTALALSSYLQSTTSKKVYYNTFDTQPDLEICQSLGITPLYLPLEDSTAEYIGRKLKSTSIAKWVMKAPFFKALFNIVPSLGNMITLGHIIDRLEKSDDEIIVLDAPSSGHILTVLESPKNFNQIFQTGALVKDIHRMLDFMQNPNFVESWILSIPTELAVTEGFELKEKLEDSGLTNIKTVLNNVLASSNEFSQENLPEFIDKKIKIEKEILSQNEGKFRTIIPMYLIKSPIELINNMKNHIKSLIEE